MLKWVRVGFLFTSVWRTLLLALNYYQDYHIVDAP